MVFSYFNTNNILQTKQPIINVLQLEGCSYGTDVCQFVVRAIRQNCLEFPNNEKVQLPASMRVVLETETMTSLNPGFISEINVVHFTSNG